MATVNELVIGALLNHGPITTKGICDITGVSYEQAARSINRLMCRKGFDIQRVDSVEVSGVSRKMPLYDLSPSEKTRLAAYLAQSTDVRHIKQRKDSYDCRKCARTVLDSPPFVPSAYLPPMAWVATQITRR